MAQEIERKWRLNLNPVHLDNLILSKTIITTITITQFYTLVDDDNEIRYRKLVHPDGRVEYTRTEKKGRGLIRKENERRISEEEFNLAKEHYLIGRVIQKTRSKVLYNEVYVLEIDVYKGDLEGLIVCEIEFPDSNSAFSFIVPDWFGEELTNNENFKNKFLALAKSLRFIFSNC